MTTFRVQAPDGRTLSIEGDDPEGAAQAAEEYLKANPGTGGASPAAPAAAPPAAAPPAPAAAPTPAAGGRSLIDLVADGVGAARPGSDAAVRQSPDYQSALAAAQARNQKIAAATHPANGGALQAASDFVTRYDPKTGLNALNMATPLPIMDEIAGGVGAARAGVGNMVANAGNAIAKYTGLPTGGNTGVDPRAVYLAEKDAENTRRQAYSAAHPVASTVAAITSGLGTPAAAAAAAPVAAAALSPAAKVAAVGSRLLQAGAVGGGYGAAYNAADADGGIPARLEAAKQGIIPGAIGGFALGGTLEAGLPLLRSGIGIGKGLAADAIRAFTTPPTAPGEAAAVLPQHTAAAGDLVEQILREGGLNTPADVQARATGKYADDPSATAAELAGRNGIGFVTNATRRPGTSADLWEGVLGGRQDSNPQHALDMVQQHLGVDPQAAQGNIDNIVAAGQTAAAPLYDAAYEAGPLDPRAKPDENLPTLENLLRRPDIEASLGSAAKLARMEDWDPRALGFTVMDGAPDGLAYGGDAAEAAAKAPAGAADFANVLRIKGIPARTRASATASPQLGPTEAELLNAIQSGASDKIRQGPSLLQFLSKEGGLSDAGGELSALDADKWHVGKPFQTKLVQPNGASIEDAAPLKAWEGGYFPELGQTPPTRDQFMEAVRKEIAGQPKYGDIRYDPARLEKVRQLNDFEAQLHRQGLDPRTASPQDVGRALTDARSLDEGMDAYGAAPGPSPEVVPEQQLTARAWDFIKRAHDGLIADKYTDRATGLLKPTDEARAAVRNNQVLRQVLDKLNPAYATARAASGDYLSQQDLFKWASNKLTYGKPADFAAKYQAASPAGRQAIRAGLAQNVLDMVNRGTLRNGKFSVPANKAVLSEAFHAKAQPFVASMEARAALNRSGARMMPGLNSTTAEAQAYGQQSGSDGLKILEPAARALFEGKPMKATGVVLGHAAMKGYSHLRTAGLPQQVRDEAGRLLTMRAQELAKFVADRAAARGSSTLALPRRAPGRAGGPIGGLTLPRLFQPQPGN